jgi:hypothetical protein
MECVKRTLETSFLQASAIEMGRIFGTGDGMAEEEGFGMAMTRLVKKKEGNQHNVIIRLMVWSRWIAIVGRNSRHFLISPMLQPLAPAAAWELSIVTIVISSSTLRSRDGGSESSPSSMISLSGSISSSSVIA